MSEIKIGEFDKTKKTLPITITPPKEWMLPSIQDIWEYRGLIYYLTLRDIRIRYKQTALGVLWVILPQLINTIIYSVLLGALARLPSEGVPYLLFVFIGQVAWGIFNRALLNSSHSLLSNASIAGKVYFPRIVLLISTVLSSQIDSIVSVCVLVIMMLGFGVMPTWKIFLLPIPILIAIWIALAVGLWLTSLSVKYRDVAQLIGLIGSIWMYASPVVYSTSLVPEGLLQKIYWLNPIAIVIHTFRFLTIGTEFVLPMESIISLVIFAIIFFGGLYYFQRTERTFIDLI